jgi:hypothetical protein
MGTGALHFGRWFNVGRDGRAAIRLLFSAQPTRLHHNGGRLAVLIALLSLLAFGGGEAVAQGNTTSTLSTSATQTITSQTYRKAKLSTLNLDR